MTDVQVFYEATPNPQSMKFVVTEPIASEAVNFSNAEDSARSPLARKLFGFPWCAGVYVGPNFVTVTKQEWVDWDILAEPLSDLIREHVLSGQPALTSAPADEDDESNDTEIVRHIKRILREEVRPAVAMDGGDIVFHKFEDGRLYLHMQGACSGCPSSAITLKDGIEARMREAIPDVLEVVSV